MAEKYLNLNGLQYYTRKLDEKKANIESPEFTGTPTINSVDVATVNDIPTDYLTSADLPDMSDYATQADIPDVSEFITAEDLPEAYDDSELRELIAAKQDKGDYLVADDIADLATKDDIKDFITEDELAEKQDELEYYTENPTIGMKKVKQGSIVVGNDYNTQTGHVTVASDAVTIAINDFSSEGNSTGDTYVAIAPQKIDLSFNSTSALNTANVSVSDEGIVFDIGEDNENYNEIKITESSINVSTNSNSTFTYNNEEVATKADIPEIPDAYTKDEIDEKLSHIDTKLFVILESLPELPNDEIVEDRIYLISTSTTDSNSDEPMVADIEVDDVSSTFDQYAAMIDDDGNWYWSFLGHVAIDLSNYYTMEEVDALIAEKTSADSLILTSPSGYKYKVSVTDDGNLTTELVEEDED